LQSWEWPRGYASSEHLIQEGKHLNGTASEQLSVVPVLRKYLVDVVSKKNVCLANVASALALTSVLDLLQHSGSGRVDGIHEAIVDHLEKHLACYGESLWIPKSHYSLHLEGRLYNTFVLEKKHKTPKKYAMNRENTSGYEQGLIEDVTVDQLQNLDDAFKPRYLLPNLKPASKGISRIVTSTLPWSHGTALFQSVRARTSTGRQVLWDDVVIWSANDGSYLVGQIHFHVQIGEDAWTCASKWEVQEWSSHVVKCIVVYKPSFIDTRRILDACVHSKAKTGEV